jgi:hypothetical protein
MRSAAALRDGGAPAGVGVGLPAGPAVVVGGAADGAGHVVPPQRAVADVPAALQHAARHGVAEPPLVVLRRAHHGAELPPHQLTRRCRYRVGERRQSQEQEERDQERPRGWCHGWRREEKKAAASAWVWLVLSARRRNGMLCFLSLSSRCLVCLEVYREREREEKLRRN